jgi:para-nitrobenzyl esterase
LLRLYPAATDADVAKAYHDLSRDVNFAGHRTWATLQTTTGRQPAYVYMFSHIGPVPTGNGNSPPPMRAAVHNSDMRYAFANLRMWDFPWREVDWKVADTMTTYWTNLARNLNPNGAGLPNWTVYDPKNERWMNIDATTRMEPFSTARMDFITAIQDENRTRR